MTRPALSGYVEPHSTNACLVTVDTGALRDTTCLIALTDWVADIACPATEVRPATARQDVADPATPARSESEKRPFELVTTEATLDHDLPCRCSHTVRPEAGGETAPDRTTDSPGAAGAGLTLSDTVELAACALETAASGATIATIATKTIINRLLTMISPWQREPKPTFVSPEPPSRAAIELVYETARVLFRIAPFRLKTSRLEHEKLQRIDYLKSPSPFGRTTLAN